MKQREKISNAFSDAYLLAIIEGNERHEVLTSFLKEFPELAQEFETNARSLDLMYAGLEMEEPPSEIEIRNAYQNVTERLESGSPVRVAVTESRGFFAAIKTLFSTSPTWAGASLGIGVAVVIALLWQPWVIKESLETAHNAHQSESPAPESKPQEFAMQDNKTSSDGTAMPEVQYRGAERKDKLTTAQKKVQDSIDEARLKTMAGVASLSAPRSLKAEANGSGSITLSWEASHGALSYLVELRSDKGGSFEPVIQVSQTRARITHLQSGKPYEIRIVPSNGERIGPPSDVTSIIVQ